MDHNLLSMSCPSLLSFTQDQMEIRTDYDWHRRPPMPCWRNIYSSRYDADSSINKGISVHLLQRSQSFQCYLSTFFSCAGRDVCAVEKHTCWNSDKIFRSTLQPKSSASLYGLFAFIWSDRVALQHMSQPSTSPDSNYNTWMFISSLYLTWVCLPYKE